MSDFMREFWTTLKVIMSQSRPNISTLCSLIRFGQKIRKKWERPYRDEQKDSKTERDGERPTFTETERYKDRQIGKGSERKR